jgi:hypothetical protein
MRIPVACLLLSTACVTREVGKQDPQPVNSAVDSIDVSPIKDVDILFVIDDSSSMEGEQASLARNFPIFIDVLEGIEGGLPNVHIGVVSSNVGAGDLAECQNGGDDGMLQIGGGDACNAPAEKFLSDIKQEDGSRLRNYTGTLEERFACMAQLGTAGCGLEAHLESMLKAVDGRNPGFLRKNAYLAIIILADEDDCSNQDDTVWDTFDQNTPNPRYQCLYQGIECEGGVLPPEGAVGSFGNCVGAEDSPMLHPRDYVAALRRIKPKAGRLLVAVIAGPVAPLTTQMSGNRPTDYTPVKTCGVIAGNGNAGAAPGYRLAQFASLVGEPYGTFHSICGSEDPPVPEPDLSPALMDIAELLGTILTNKCLPRNADLTDVMPSQPGVQPECTVVDATHPGDTNEIRTVVPRCPINSNGTPNRATLPCWWLTDDTTCSPTLTNQKRIQVERDGAAPLDTELMIDCHAI